MNLHLLKTIVSIGEKLQEFNSLDFSNVKIKVNVLMNHSISIMYVLDVFEIPYERINVERQKEIDFDENLEDSIRTPELNFSVGLEVDLKVLYYLSVISNEIFQTYDKHGMNIYINYSWQPEEKKTTILFGSYVRKDQNWTNISKAIKPVEIAKLPIEKMSWKKVKQMFPNINHAYDGKCTYTERGDYDNYDSDRKDNLVQDNSDRDTFDALTGGQYGDYDDWRENGGDFDSLRDSLGLT